MELPRPNAEGPALLALGPRDPSYVDLERLCERAQIRLDRADTEAHALRLFLERGGHDAVLCAGRLRDGTDVGPVVDKLRTIDPELELWDFFEVRRRLSGTSR